jgi:hypothetical protein
VSGTVPFEAAQRERRTAYLIWEVAFCLLTPYWLRRRSRLPDPPVRIARALMSIDAIAFGGLGAALALLQCDLGNRLGSVRPSDVSDLLL